MTIKERLQQKKQEAFKKNHLLQYVDEVLQTIRNDYLKFQEEIRAKVPKDGVNGIDGLDGRNGENYVLTEQDKKEIAASIAVPIVEKVIEKTETVVRITPGETVREVIHETPIVTEIVREVAQKDTPEEIITKINTTKDAIPMSVIQGLEEKIRFLERTAREKKTGGGGMGTPQHETFSVSSVTTTITTRYPIAFQGYGIMTANYQGGFITRGVHYTVGGDRKTLTLLFSPQDGTSIDIIYIR